MNIKTIIVKSELKFRKYIKENADNISKIIIFEDILDHIIFFYCFTKDNSIISTKESATMNFFIYQEIYKLLANELALDIITNHKEPKTLKLIK